MPMKFRKSIPSTHNANSNPGTAQRNQNRFVRRKLIFGCGVSSMNDVV